MCVRALLMWMRLSCVRRERQREGEEAAAESIHSFGACDVCNNFSRVFLCFPRSDTGTNYAAASTVLFVLLVARDKKGDYFNLVFNSSEWIRVISTNFSPLHIPATSNLWHRFFSRRRFFSLGVCTFVVSAILVESFWNVQFFTLSNWLNARKVCA